MIEAIERFTESRLYGRAREALFSLLGRIRERLTRASRERQLILSKLDSLDDRLDSIEELLQDELDARRRGF